MDRPWMLYGANGYTGRLILDLAIERGLRPVLAGRSAEKIKPLADKHDLEMRIFDLDEAAKVESNLEGMGAVLHAAGPYSQTSRPMVLGCMATGAHYLDITGEYHVFERIMKVSDKAKAAGVVLLPGVGFDVVPTDCIAAMLKAEMPEANSLELAFGAFGGKGPSVSKGTLKTMIEGAGYGAVIRRNGKIVNVPFTYKTPHVPFKKGAHRCVTLAWGDVSTAYHSTGIENIIVYSVMPVAPIRVMGWLGPIMRIPPVVRFLQSRVEKNMDGPDEESRKTSVTALWGRVKNDQGEQVVITGETRGGYSFTADSSLLALVKVLNGEVEPGSWTPSRAFGKNFVLETDGAHIDPPVRGPFEPLL
ncbi:MAG: saccharopine dehydrogenase NADP-binding domain-containing protein [Deltaproteobacteria bacterium]|nr:saccharopine dehydrogenase NADP-binding domain-containing protein [Deltaproteobacteria bacterium]